MATTPSTFSNTVIHLDGQFFQGIRFEKCQMVYSGGFLPTLLNNQFIQCTWRMEGAASQTLDYLRLLIAIGGKDLVMEALGLQPPPIVVSQNG